VRRTRKPSRAAVVDGKAGARSPSLETQARQRVFDLQLRDSTPTGAASVTWLRRLVQLSASNRVQAIGANQEICGRLTPIREPRDHSVGLVLDRDAPGAAMNAAFVQPGGQFPKQVRSVNDHANGNSQLSFQVEKRDGRKDLSGAGAALKAIHLRTERQDTLGDTEEFQRSNGIGPNRQARADFPQLLGLLEHVGLNSYTSQS
jgi:hypothetical protein